MGSLRATEFDTGSGLIELKRTTEPWRRCLSVVLLSAINQSLV